jgi:tRNA(Arg) A34 adenosine deaminase TadA
MCHGMVRVVAKRATGNLCAVDHQLGLPGKFVEIPSQALPGLNESAPYNLLLIGASAPDTEIKNTFIQSVIELRNKSHRTPGPRHQSDRPVAAILVSEAHQILAWAVNTSSKNKTLHAEVNLIRHFQKNVGGKLPRGSKIYTTLKPCKMCAGLIWTAAEDIRSMSIYFLEDDLGPYAKATVLNPGTHERLRATQNAALQNLKLEEQVKQDLP